MHPNEHILTDFFTAFQKHNTEGMIAFYSPDIVFSDSIYGTLKGPQVAAMWHIHELQAKYQVFTFTNISADDHTGRADWQAGYIYTRTGRHVLNRVHAEFRFVNNKIVEQHDTFNLWRWASMALGTQGLLLGWTPFMQASIRAQVKANLEDYMKEKHIGYANSPV